MDKIKWNNFVRNRFTMFKFGRQVFVTATITVLCFLSITYVSCKKETTTPSVNECASVTCQNGGTCFKGMCSCLGGYEGERCQVKAILRYTGSWKVKEKIMVSTDPAAVNKTREYTMNVKEQADSKIGFLIDNFMGEAAFVNVQAEQARNGKGEPAAYTTFTFIKDQLLGGTTTFIVSGSGTVNDLGTVLQGTYEVSYVSGNKLEKDTITFEAEHL